jgi:hypothetical protein
MAGVEATASVQLIDACICITKTIPDIDRAVQDAQGLPPRCFGFNFVLPHSIESSAD